MNIIIGIVVTVALVGLVIALVGAIKWYGGELEHTRSILRTEREQRRYYEKLLKDYQRCAED